MFLIHHFPLIAEVERFGYGNYLNGLCIETVWLELSDIIKVNFHLYRSDCYAKYIFICKFNFQIYTDWANHYLERGRSGRRVRQLAECGDGRLLRDLLEAVTGQRVPDCRGHQVSTLILNYTIRQTIGTFGINLVLFHDVDYLKNSVYK